MRRAVLRLVWLLDGVAFDGSGWPFGLSVVLELVEDDDGAVRELSE